MNTSWQGNRKTTPLKAMQHVKELLSSSEIIGDVDAEVLTLLIGQMLIQLHYIMQLSLWLDKSARFNLDTPLMVEASLRELLATAIHTMNTCDQAKTSISTLTQSQWISKNRRLLWLGCEGISEIAAMALEYHNLG